MLTYVTLKETLILQQRKQMHGELSVLPKVRWLAGLEPRPEPGRLLPASGLSTPTPLSPRLSRLCQLIELTFLLYEMGISGAQLAQEIGGPDESTKV